MPMSVEALISSMDWAASNNLSEYGFRRDGCRVSLQRGAEGSVTAPVPAAKPAAAQTPEEASGGLEAIEAPLSGTCYLAQDAGSPPFVEIGAAVSTGQTICLIEAMKVMTSVTADRDGTLEEICIVDGATVEAGASLMRVRT
ncbi:acetyl-CoA carboxylase biotin carboxyl carrier protein [Marinovum sp.]|uniref:acetyl-CoA carboxylase biotin carboxyl carrier protein n=1 Tax=Marinovum sp. TaxID=2024839 RepID=UPI003A95C043